MTQRSARETVAQAIADFDDIREAIRGHRIEVPYPTKTSMYAELIANIRIGSVSGAHRHCGLTELIRPLSGERMLLFEKSHPPLMVLVGSAQIIEED